MKRERRPYEVWRTAFYFDCQTARERDRVLRDGFRVDEDGCPPSFTRVVTGFFWFPIKLLVREVRGLPKTDWESYRVDVTDSLFDYYELPWGVASNARLFQVRRKRVAQAHRRQGDWRRPLFF